ncbi:MAG: hypothetical protein H0V49_08100, partial [Nocardioidaceae bacterium]|nr:hypothetical protein [Nocardioidaceae bacterium]
MAVRSLRASMALDPFVVDGLVAVALLLGVSAQVGAGDIDAETTRYLLLA